MESDGAAEDIVQSPPPQPPKIGWHRRVTTKVYVAHAITTWGDRMWAFAIALFLVKMSSGFQLRLAAVYGLVCCCSIIIFGGVVGKWVDKNPRITVAWKALVVQNSLVVACALLLGGVMYNLKKLQQPDLLWLFSLLQAVIIILGAAAYLASTASNISIAKDWVVVIAKKDKNKLAIINAACRRIDLTTKICSPMLVGALMAQLSDVVATIFIASWNVFSMAAEFFLLLSIYKQVPELAIKNRKGVPNANKELMVKPEVRRGQAPLAEEEISWADEQSTEKSKEDNTEEDKKMPAKRIWIVQKLYNYFNLWGNYFKHPVFPAGLGLACLYMTVLAFDAITIGYSYSQGVSEIVLGSLGGAGALTGIVGTMFYPWLRRKIGIERTGLIGFFLEVSCLSLCVASVWAPGSPFEPSSIFPSHNKVQTYTPTPVIENASSLAENITYTTDETLMSSYVPKRDYTSIVLLMTGIVAARVGLWMADMTVNQIIQEEVEESQRGSINGVQHSLNMIMDLVKYILVIMLPSPEQFGYLVMASFTVICLGWLSYAIYSRRIRHHILPFHRYFHCNSENPVPDLRGKKNSTDL